ncbi:anthranilate phosphoribosyltransferase, partial [Enterococcus hirae]
GVASLDGIRGGDAAHNAKALRALLDGANTPYRNIVLLIVAAALIVAGKAKDLKSGAGMAAEAIDSGRAKEKLERLIYRTNKSPGLT